MQKIFTLCILSILCFSVKAQFKKGDKVPGVSLNFQSYSSEISSAAVPQTSKNSEFNLYGKLGFATKENQLSGFLISGGYGVDKREYSTQPTADSKYNSFNVGGGYFMRRYKPIFKSFYIFGDGRAGLNYSQKKNNINTNNPEERQYGINLGVYPGLAYKWSSKFLLELRFSDLVSCGYSQREVKSASNIKDVQKSFSVNSNLGLNYFSSIGIGGMWILK